jgi:hypothetical protein
MRDSTDRGKGRRPPSSIERARTQHNQPTMSAEYDVIQQQRVIQTGPQTQFSRGAHYEEGRYSPATQGRQEHSEYDNPNAPTSFSNLSDMNLLAHLQHFINTEPTQANRLSPSSSADASAYPGHTFGLRQEYLIPGSPQLPRENLVMSHPHQESFEQPLTTNIPSYALQQDFLPNVSHPFDGRDDPVMMSIEHHQPTEFTDFSAYQSNTFSPSSLSHEGFSTLSPPPLSHEGFAPFSPPPLSHEGFAPFSPPPLSHEGFAPFSPSQLYHEGFSTSDFHQGSSSGFDGQRATDLPLHTLPTEPSIPNDLHPIDGPREPATIATEQDQPQSNSRKRRRRQQPQKKRDRETSKPQEPLDLPLRLRSPGGEVYEKTYKDGYQQWANEINKQRANNPEKKLTEQQKMKNGSIRTVKVELTRNSVYDAEKRGANPKFFENISANTKKLQKDYQAYRQNGDIKGASEERYKQTNKVRDYLTEQHSVLVPVHRYTKEMGTEDFKTIPGVLKEAKRLKPEDQELQKLTPERVAQLAQVTPKTRKK